MANFVVSWAQGTWLGSLPSASWVNARIAPQGFPQAILRTIRAVRSPRGTASQRNCLGQGELWNVEDFGRFGRGRRVRKRGQHDLGRETQRRSVDLRRFDRGPL